MIKYRITYPNWAQVLQLKNDIVVSDSNSGQVPIVHVIDVVDIKDDYIIIKNLNNDGSFDDAVNVWELDLIAMYLGQENSDSGYPIFKFLHEASEAEMEVLRNKFPKIDQFL